MASLPPVAIPSPPGRGTPCPAAPRWPLSRQPDPATQPGYSRLHTGELWGGRAEGAQASNRWARASSSSASSTSPRLGPPESHMPWATSGDPGALHVTCHACCHFHHPLNISSHTYILSATERQNSCATLLPLLARVGPLCSQAPPSGALLSQGLLADAPIQRSRTAFSAAFRDGCMHEGRMMACRLDPCRDAHRSLPPMAYP